MPEFFVSVGELNKGKWLHPNYVGKQATGNNSVIKMAVLVQFSQGHLSITSDGHLLIIVERAKGEPFV